MQLLDTPPRSHTFWRALSLYHACRLDPIAQDVAHVQFRSRIAFKMVWCPPSFSSFVLVDDDGAQIFLQRSPVKKMTRCVSLRVPA